MRKKAEPKFEITPQLIGLALVLLIGGLLLAWYLSADTTGPDHGDIPDIRETKKAQGR